MKLVNNLDVNKNQLLNALLQIISGNHATPVEGLIWYDSNAQAIKFRDATTINTLGVAGQGGDAATLDGNDGVWYLDRANHTGSQASTTISDWAEAVADAVGAMLAGNTETGITVDYQDSDNTIDFVIAALNSLPAPTGDLSLNSQKIVSLAAPTAATDAATKGYVDTAVTGLGWKDSVRAASTANVDIAQLNNGDQVDGITLATGDRVLLKNQTAPAENGIYTIGATAGTSVRSDDANTALELEGAAVMVEEGTQANTQWIQTADNFTLDTNDVTWTQFGGAQTYTAGDGLTLTGNDFDVNAGTGLEISGDTVRIAAAAAGDGLTGGGGSALAVGAGTGISVTADAVAIDTAVVARKYSALIGNGALTSIAVTHNLNTRDVQVQVYDAATYEQVLVNNTRNTVNQVTLDFAVAPATDSLRVVVIG